MTTLAVSGCKHQAATYPTDTLTTKNGSQLTITFFKHASLAIETEGRHIYIDPISQYADYASLPKADLILITHSHYDHLDSAGRRRSLHRSHNRRVRPDQQRNAGRQVPDDEAGRYARPARLPLDRSCSGLQHLRRPSAIPPPRKRGLRLRPDYRRYTHLHRRRRGKYTRNESPAWHRHRLPARQSTYTMTVDQAVDAVKAIRPAIFYPIITAKSKRKPTSTDCPGN